jgi:hypothetical protein
MNEKMRQKPSRSVAGAQGIQIGVEEVAGVLLME